MKDEKIIKNLVCRYQDLVNTAKKKVVPSWVYNLGENIQSIQAVKHHLQKEALVLALSDHNFICFGANGSIKFTKRLQYSPICFYCYLNGNTLVICFMVTIHYLLLLILINF